MKTKYRRPYSPVPDDVKTLECADGRPLRVVGTHLDITERKRAEQEVKNQLYELQRRQAVIMRREDRVSELKREVNELLVRHSQPPRYASTEAL